MYTMRNKCKGAPLLAFLLEICLDDLASKKRDYQSVGLDLTLALMYIPRCGWKAVLALWLTCRGIASRLIDLRVKG